MADSPIVRPKPPEATNRLIPDPLSPKQLQQYRIIPPFFHPLLDLPDFMVPDWGEIETLPQNEKPIAPQPPAPGTIEVDPASRPPEYLFGPPKITESRPNDRSGGIGKISQFADSSILRALQQYRELEARNGSPPPSLQGTPVPSPRYQDAEGASVGGKSPVPVLSEFIDGKRVVPSVDASPPLVPSNDPSVNSYPTGGGLAAWIAAVAGIDPNNPNRISSPPQARKVNGFNRDNDPTLPWYLQSR